jgi:hypothetical protein
MGIVTYLENIQTKTYGIFVSKYIGVVGIKYPRLIATCRQQEEH